MTASGIVYNMDYYDEMRSSSRSHYEELLEDDEDGEEAFFSQTDSIYSFPKCKHFHFMSIVLVFR